MNNQWFSKVAVWLVIALVLFTVFKQFDRGVTQGNQVGYSDFLEEVRSKRVKSVTLQENPGGGTEIIATTTDDKRLRSTATYLDRGLVGDLIASGVKFDVKPREEPSISTNIWFSVCSRSSLPPPRPAPRWRPTASISSMKIMQGALFLACSNMSRTRAAPTPTNISTKSEPLMLKNGTLASPAIALASKVLPVPGGPTSSTPRGMRPPSF